MTRAILGAVALVCALVLTGGAADARPKLAPQSLSVQCNNNGRCIPATSVAFGRESKSHQTLAGAGRPAGCPHAWCGCGLALKLFGRNVRELWLARAWLKFPRVSGPVTGSVAVLSRGRRGGHVGIVRGVDANGNPIIFSGNHNRAWGEAVYPKGRVIAYVMP
jgi:hypothetical protein